MGGLKSDKNELALPKLKKTSTHMSQELNKTRSQKSLSVKGPLLNKLPAIFKRVTIKK